MNTILHSIAERGRSSEYQIIAFGIFGFISYPLYYLLWAYVSPQGYENLYLRVIASGLCIPLMAKNYWPTNLKKLLPYYWLFVLMYCGPFFFTFMLFMKDFSMIWQLNAMSALVWLVLLTDAFSLLLITLIGLPLGWLCYWLATPEPIPINGDVGSLIVFLSVFIFSTLFAFKKEKFHNEKIEVMKMLAASIAHELRTPLRSISSGVGGIKKALPALIQSYRLAKNAQVEVPRINPFHYEALTTVCDTVESEVRSAFTVIDVLLANVSHAEIAEADLVSCSINDCIQEIILRYPFDQGERDLVRYDSVQDFTFIGQKLAVVHVLFNLMKNSLYHIRASSKKDANITLSTSQDQDYYFLHFKDTGTGISADALPYVFERFYSRTYHGAGIGLSFCKHAMEAIGGKIVCHSMEGEYAEFVLKFPKKKEVLEGQGEKL